MKQFGTRYEVFCGEAQRTRYGLTKEGLVMSHGKVVSKKKHEHAMANKAEYVDKMNARRRNLRAPSPAPARPSSPSRVEDIVIPAHRARPLPTAPSQLQRLAAAASRTW